MQTAGQTDASVVQ